MRHVLFQRGYYNQELSKFFLYLFFLFFWFPFSLLFNVYILAYFAGYQSGLIVFLDTQNLIQFHSGNINFPTVIFVLL